MAIKVKSFTPELLRSIRRRKGFSREKLAKYAGLSAQAILKYENGLVTPSPERWECLYSILAGEEGTSHPSDAWNEVQEQFIHTPVTFSFKEGQCYSITDRGARGFRSVSDWNVDALSVFRYTRKRGIHHCFSEVTSGWCRTYTDAQLIGKTIKEVHDEQA